MFHYWFLIGVHIFIILSIRGTNILSCIHWRNGDLFFSKLANKVLFSKLANKVLLIEFALVYTK
jgi:hypothetical protein